METRLECLTRRYLKCPSGMYPAEIWELVKLQHAEIERLQKEVRRWQLRQRIGWYNSDTKRFCYSDVKDAYPDSHASYSIPVFIEAAEAGGK